MKPTKGFEKVLNNNLQHQHEYFTKIIQNTYLLDDSLNSKTILSFYEDSLRRIESKDFGLYENIRFYEDVAVSLEKLASRIKIGIKTFELELSKMEVAQVKEGIKNQKRFTTTTAGIYIADKIARKNPISRVTINKYITEGKLVAREIKGNRKEILQVDLDLFIKNHGDLIKDF